MRVEGCDDNAQDFFNVPRAAGFVANGDLFIKTEHVNGTNAVRLSDGVHARFNGSDEVKPVRAKAIIEKW